MRELCDELLEVADLGPVGDEVLAEREGFEYVEPLEDSGELRFKDASEVGVRELVEVEYDRFVDDWRVGGRWNGSKTLLETGLGTVEDTFALGLGLLYAAKSGLPWWGFIVALIFSTAFVPILGTLYATVGYQPSLQFLIQMVGGAMIPGKPVANMYFTLCKF